MEVVVTHPAGSFAPPLQLRGAARPMSSQRGRLFHPGVLFMVAAASVLSLPRWAAAQQPVTITGDVTSDVGAPLTDASVFIQSMNLATTTRGDGRYTIVIPSRLVAGQ